MWAAGKTEEGMSGFWKMERAGRTGGSDTPRRTRSVSWATGEMVRTQTNIYMWVRTKEHNSQSKIHLFVFGQLKKFAYICDLEFG
jgi:hypothetical protein